MQIIYNLTDTYVEKLHVSSPSGSLVDNVISIAVFQHLDFDITASLIAVPRHFGLVYLTFPVSSLFKLPHM